MPGDIYNKAQEKKKTRKVASNALRAKESEQLRQIDAETRIKKIAVRGLV